MLNVSERGDRAYIGIVPSAASSTTRGPATWSTSARWARSSRRTSCTRRARGTSTAPPSVCPGCTQGCNITIDTRDNIVVRLRPRANLEVNRHFMCDEGRMHYRWMNRGDRIEAPLVREGGRHVAVDWDTALARLAQVARGGAGSAVVLASGRARPRVARLGRAGCWGATRSPRAVQVPLGDEAPLAGVPDLALRARAGAQPRGRPAAGLRRRLGRGRWPRPARPRSSSCSMSTLDRGRGGRAGRRRHRGGARRRWSPAAWERAEPRPPDHDDGRGARDLRSTATGGSSGTSRPRRRPGMARPAWWVAARSHGVGRRRGGARPAPPRRRSRRSGAALAGPRGADAIRRSASAAGRRRAAAAGAALMTPGTEGLRPGARWSSWSWSSPSS